MAKDEGEQHPVEAESSPEPHGDPIGGGEPGYEICGATTHQFPPHPCKNRAGMGTNHVGEGRCKFHGGKASQVERAAARRQVEEGARTELERNNLQPVGDPLRELQMLAAEVIKFKEILGDKVEELGAWTSESLMESEELRAVISAYERALDRTNNVLAGIVRLNIEERLARVSEIQAALLISVFEAVFSSKEAALSKQQVLTIKAIVAREIPRVTGRAA